METITNQQQDLSIQADLLRLVEKHDYSYQFSDSNSVWERGMNNENRIKQMITALVEYRAYDAKELFNGCIEVRDEQYTNGLTHKTIHGWFNKYL